jgi:hypothetical protein
LKLSFHLTQYLNTSYQLKILKKFQLFYAFSK